MLKSSTRRLFTLLVATVVCTITTIAGGVTPAHAAPSGYLLMKGTGSVYTANEIVNLGGVPGAAARTFSFKLVNTGATSEQFKVNKSVPTAGSTATLLRGSTVLPPSYYTAPIAPGGSLVLTLKISLAAGVAPGDYYTSVYLRDPETNAILDGATADVNATYQSGNTGHDLFLKTGTQPYVGGVSVVQYETANALKVGNIATFLLRLQNNTGTPRAISLKASAATSCPSSFVVTVKQGTSNVTTAVNAGTYSTGVLAPGARKDLKVTIKLISASPCTAAYFGYQASGTDGTMSHYAHVVMGV